MKLEASPIVISGSQPACQNKIPQPQLQSRFGLSVTATLLAMATIYVALQRNQIVRPSIVVIPRDASGCPIHRAEGACGPLVPGASREAADDFAILREGLHGVAGSQGTAKGLRETQSRLEAGTGERLFVKTGTATARITHNHAHFSLWGAGWVDGASGRGAIQIPKSRGFSCVATNQDNGFGGSVCGPIVKDLLGRLGREGVP